MFNIVFAEGVADDLRALRPFDRTHVLNEMDRHLVHQPTLETRAKKMLRGLTPPWEHVPPVWELRVSEYRVLYDVDEIAGQVIVRTVRRKPPHLVTEQIL